MLRDNKLHIHGVHGSIFSKSAVFFSNIAFITTKEGSRFDLPIALGILAASGQLPAQALSEHEFIGELALDGGLRPVRGALPTAIQCTSAGRRLILPQANAQEAGLAQEACILPALHLLQVSAH